jgi:hypothetical protein
MLDRDEILSLIRSAETEEEAADAIHQELQNGADADALEAYWRDQLG